MITEQDITTLRAVFVTKEEFNTVAVKVDGIQETVGDLKVEVGEINDKFDTLIVTIDSFVGSIRTLEQENSAGAHILERHGRQLTTLAREIGIVLPN